MRIIGFFIMSAVFISVVLLTNPAQAYYVQSFSCGGGQQPILVGDNEDVVLMKCGQPTYREADAWIYDRGVDSTMAVIYDGSTPFRRKVLGVEIKLKSTF